MKTIIYTVFAVISFMGGALLESAQAQPAESSLTATAVAFANPTLIHVFNHEGKHYAVLSNHSIWELNPDSSEISKDDYTLLLNQYVTLMPGKEPSEYPINLIISKAGPSISAKLLSVPTDSLKLVDLDSSGSQLQIDSPSGGLLQYLEIIPDNHEMVQRWQKGQKVVISGIWFPEFDPQGRSDCAYLYTLYNYDTQEFTRFIYIN